MPDFPAPTANDIVSFSLTAAMPLEHVSALTWQGLSEPNEQDATTSQLRRISN
jgi:hypothetical protein